LPCLTDQLVGRLIETGDRIKGIRCAMLVMVERHGVEAEGSAILADKLGRCMMRWLLMVLLMLLTPVVTTSRTAAQSAADEAVLNARETALLARDVEAVLQRFADDALVVTSSGRLLRRRAQIRSWVQDQVERSQRDEAGRRYQRGTKLSWPGKVYRDDWQQMGISPLEVTQDAIIREGKIHSFNTSFTPESAARFQAARKKH
jgi:hypothetical protein